MMFSPFLGIGGITKQFMQAKQHEEKLYPPGSSDRYITTTRGGGGRRQFRLTQLFFGTPHISASTVFSSILTIPLNIAANTTAWTEGRGSKPAPISSQNPAYVDSREGRWEQGATGCTAAKYCVISRFAASRYGRNCKTGGWSVACPNTNPLVGTIYWSPGCRYSGNDPSEIPPSDMLSKEGSADAGGGRWFDIVAEIYRFLHVR